MNAKCSRAKTVFWVPLAGFGVLLAGCNVDGLWGDRQAPRGAQKVSFHGRGGDHAVDITVTDAQEIDLVENLVMHRLAYLRTLADLRIYYERHGYAHKEQWASYEMDGLEAVKMFRYLLDAEIPGGDLQPILSKGLASTRIGGSRDRSCGGVRRESIARDGALQGGLAAFAVMFRESPDAAVAGGRSREWRRGWDSNPRRSFRPLPA